MSGNRTAVPIDRYNPREVELSCGCNPLFKASPPEKGDLITCLIHGNARVIGRKKQGASTQDRSSSNAT